MATHYIVTGGAGFIGSHLVEHVIAHPHSKVTCLDKLSYATNGLLGNLSAVKDLPNFVFVKTDIAQDPQTVAHAIADAAASTTTRHVVVLNLAAESCVDQSFDKPLYFTQNNIFATQHVLEALRALLPESKRKVALIHISTDEVYGEQLPAEVAYESTRLCPLNPYAATKAACDMLIEAYVKSYGICAALVRGNNVYGPRQYPEKLVAVAIDSLARGKPVPLHGDGLYCRMYLHVRDFVAAVDLITRETLRSDPRGKVFNVGSSNEILNKEVARLIASHFNRQEDYYVTMPDRPYNDKRYAIDSAAVEALGWTQKISFQAGVADLVKEMATARKEEK